MAGCSARSEPPMMSIGDAESVTDRPGHRVPMTMMVSLTAGAAPWAAGAAACWASATEEPSAVTESAARALTAMDRRLRMKLAMDNLSLF